MQVVDIVERAIKKGKAGYAKLHCCDFFKDEFVACIDIKCGHRDDITCEDCIFNNGDRRLPLEEINIKEEN